jgi:hypothetical protein
MNELLSNPRALVALACLLGIVIGVNLTLLGTFRHSKFLQDQAKIWGNAMGGGAEVRKRQQDQLDELHQRVQGLKSGPPKEE